MGCFKLVQVVDHQTEREVVEKAKQMDLHLGITRIVLVVVVNQTLRLDLPAFGFIK